jgi:hypothetical protein
LGVIRRPLAECSEPGISWSPEQGRQCCLPTPCITTTRGYAGRDWVKEAKHRAAEIRSPLTLKKKNPSVFLQTPQVQLSQRLPLIWSTC